MSVQPAPDVPSLVLPCQTCGSPVVVPAEALAAPSNVKVGVQTLTVVCGECEGKPAPGYTYEVRVAVVRLGADALPFSPPADEPGVEVLGGFAARGEGMTLGLALPAISAGLERSWVKFQEGAVPIIVAEEEAAVEAAPEVEVSGGS